MKNMCLSVSRVSAISIVCMFCLHEKNAENSHLNSNTHPYPWMFPCLSPPPFPYDWIPSPCLRPAAQTEEEQARLAKTEAETSFRAILDSYEFRMPQVRFRGQDYFALFF